MKPARLLDAQGSCQRALTKSPERGPYLAQQAHVGGERALHSAQVGLRAIAVARAVARARALVLIRHGRRCGALHERPLGVGVRIPMWWLQTSLQGQNTEHAAE